MFTRSRIYFEIELISINMSLKDPDFVLYSISGQLGDPDGISWPFWKGGSISRTLMRGSE
jgi:hypothetical protein